MTDWVNPCPECGGPRRMKLDIPVQRDDGRTYTQPCSNNEFHKFVEREAAGYQYLDDRFAIVHTTSIPLNDKEAFEYVTLVEVWHPNTYIKYISRREFGSTVFQMMPVQFDNETKEVTEIGSETPQIS